MKTFDHFLTKFLAFIKSADKVHPSLIAVFVFQVGIVCILRGIQYALLIGSLSLFTGLIIGFLVNEFLDHYSKD